MAFLFSFPWISLDTGLLLISEMGGMGGGGLSETRAMFILGREQGDTL